MRFRTQTVALPTFRRGRTRSLLARRSAFRRLPGAGNGDGKVAGMVEDLGVRC